jgi:S-adenosyl-L-methionine hydrolase (adenosine-forming)
LSVLTFLSDFGADSHYMASFRGAMHKASLQIPFIEITSRIEPFDIVEAAYLSSMVYQDFAEGSIHVLATNVVATSFNGHLAAFYNGHYFLAPDNGVLSLIFGEDFSDYYLIPTETYEQKIQNIYLPFIAQITAGMALGEIASKATQVHTNSRLTPVNDGLELRGTVLFVDHFGNAYTNILKDEFYNFTKKDAFIINLGKHTQVDVISNNFSEVKEGEPLCYFSDHGYLVVSIKKSSAQRLLNFRKYKPLVIQKV